MNCLACHGERAQRHGDAGAREQPDRSPDLSTEDVRKIKLLRLKKLGHMDLAILKLPLNVTNGTTNSAIFGVILGSLRNPDMSVDKNRPVPALMHHDMDAPPGGGCRRSPASMPTASPPRTTGRSCSS